MKKHAAISIFGEVLYDCFPDGQAILGGAPFNVAWSLQAFGDRPRFISRVGRDGYGEKVFEAMQSWGMDTGLVQVDDTRPTGQVAVSFIDDEPSYDIVNNCAYDFIASDQLPENSAPGILYHGSLGLRNRCSYAAYDTLIANGRLKVYFDVNLRAPWWTKEEILRMLPRASWLKLNLEELNLLAVEQGDLQQKVAALMTSYDLEQVIVTRGEEGAVIRTATGDWLSSPVEKADHFVDTVGAGDAFSAMYLHGLLTGVEVMDNLERAQKFAARVVGIRGATTTELSLYRQFL